jgi:glycosyltransferase involved in cell wall biosynthesis
VQIVQYYPTALVGSGVTVALWAWSGALAAAGVSVRIACADVSGDRRWFTTPPTGVDVVTLPHRGRRRLTSHPIRLGRHLGDADVLVLHEGWVPANFVAARAARDAGVPYVVVPHGVYEAAWRPYLRGPVRLRELAERRLIEAAAAVHVFFASEMEDVAALAPRARALVAPTGFPVPRERWTTGGGGYLAWVGRYDPYHKGLDLLVEAVARLPDHDRPRIQLRGYDYRGGLERLRAEIAGRDVGRWIDVGPPIEGPAKTAFLLASDGYLHPSRWESYGLALVEALALGVPTLVSRSIRIADSLIAADAALAAEPEPVRLGAGLVRLADGGSGYGPRGRSFVETQLAWERIVPGYLDDLARLTARGSG